MATKIFYNDNRIIIDGHADTTEECQAITALCDSLANDENFKTIVYESGHAVFEQVSGGDSEMFAMQDYVLTGRYDAETGYSAAELAAHGTIRKRLEWLEDYTEQIWQFNPYRSIGSEYVGSDSGDYIDEHGTVVARLEALEAISSRLNALESAFASFQLLTSRVTALENKSTKTLPYTADELIAKLESI